MADSFADDSPRSDPETQDRFGYGPFAKRLARVIQTLEAPNGYVIGLHGAWGAGKTTTLKFVEHYITADKRANASNGIEVIWFSPWIFTTHENLVTEFFRYLTEQLKPGSEAHRRLKAGTKKLAEQTVDPIAAAASKVAAATLPHASPFISGGSLLGRWWLKQRINEWLAEPTLPTAREELAAALRSSDRRFVIFIDDIDRLDDAAIRTMLQMVKSVGHLPNVIYVLAYDRRIVYRALGEPLGRQAGEPAFAEKIVQQELELPYTGWPPLSRALDIELRPVLSAIPNSARWSTIITSGLRRWVRYPRDVVRLGNALRFSWPSLATEVDPADVIAMEGLRLFEQDAFEWIKHNRELLIEPRSFLSEADQKAKVGSYRNTLSPGRDAEVMELLALLFPRQASLLQPEDRLSAGDSWAEAMSRGGICTPRGYDAYFSLFRSSFLIPKELVDQAVASPDDSAIQVEAVKRACQAVGATGRSLIGDYLDELLYRFAARQKIKPGAPMFLALLGAAPFIYAQKPTNGLSFPAWINLHQLLRIILEQHSMPKADIILLDATGSCDSAETLATLYVWRAREAGRLPRESQEGVPVISDAALDRLASATLRQIEVEVADGRLAKSSQYFDIMHSWCSLGDADSAKSWLETSIADSPQVLARTTKGFLASTVNQDGTTVYMFRGFGENRQFFNSTTLLLAAERFADVSGLTDDERKRIVATRDGLRKMAQQVSA